MLNFSLENFKLKSITLYYILNILKKYIYNFSCKNFFTGQSKEIYKLIHLRIFK